MPKLTQEYVLLSLVIHILHTYGVRTALYFAAVFSVLGVWIRFIAAKVDSAEGGHFGAVMFGQILIGTFNHSLLMELSLVLHFSDTGYIGFAQPFVLGAPAYYSDLWFTSKGRVTANALISLSNPLGAAVRPYRSAL